jgi:hypothetical protein
LVGCSCFWIVLVCGAIYYKAYYEQVSIIYHYIIYLSIYLSIYFSIYLCWYCFWVGCSCVGLILVCAQSIIKLNLKQVSITLYIYTSIYLFICLYFYLSIYLSIYTRIIFGSTAVVFELFSSMWCDLWKAYSEAGICVSISLLSIHISLYLSIFFIYQLYIYLSIYVPISLCSDCFLLCCDLL